MIQSLNLPLEEIAHNFVLILCFSSYLFVHNMNLSILTVGVSLEKTIQFPKFVTLTQQVHFQYKIFQIVKFFGHLGETNEVLQT